jgi:hypothetical protein
MENLDISILTSILAIAFLVFLVATYKDFKITDFNQTDETNQDE